MLLFKKLKWALRKAKLPVGRNDLVLDVGSGGTPYPRSDVLLDRLTGADHRCGESMMIDRYAVFGDAQNMPFKDKSFDFIVASHILEHMADPERFIAELQRVGKAGYIETPNAIFERLFPYSIHSLEIMSIGDVLHIHKKSRPVEDSFLGALSFLNRDEKWSNLFLQQADMFHVRIFWDTEIKYKIHNPEVSCKWIENINMESETGESKGNYLEERGGWRKLGLSILGRWYAMQRVKRLNDFDLTSVLRCTSCKSDLRKHKAQLVCTNCSASYPCNPLPDFTEL